MMSERRITFTLNRLVNALNAAADRILREQFKLTFSQFQFLVVLDACGTIPSKTFAEQLGVSAAAVSKRLAWFEQRGFIQTGTIPRDRRTVTVTISKHGKDLLSQTSGVLEESFRKGFADLQSVNVDELNATLLTVLDHLTHNESLEHHT